MRVLIELVFVLMVVALFSTVFAKTEDRLNPKLSPQFVALLKDQADARKTFYADQAKAKADQKEAHAKEQRALLEQHRESRAKFNAEKHSSDERSSFYKGQRAEMAALKNKQRSEHNSLEEELRKKLAEFHARQKQDKDTLQDKLMRVGDGRVSSDQPITSKQ